MKFLDADGSFVGCIGTAIDATERKLAEDALATVSGRLIEAQEKERTRIARELHDDISQSLALLAIELQRFKDILPNSPANLRNQAQQLVDSATEISSAVHALSHELHSSKLEVLGLVPAMRGFCAELAKKQGLEIKFSHEGIQLSVPQEISLCLFRVMQEALQNAVKHSEVRHFEVNVQGSSTEIHLTVQDSGVGFDPESTLNNQGLGLISMRERVNLVKGAFLITSTPQSGTEISVRAPLSARG
jgi:signal transduction histidine kinase